MTSAPRVIVSSTTGIIRDASRVQINESYISALIAAGLLPLVLPPIEAALAVASLAGVAGLVLSGGEDLDPARFGQTPHPATGVPHAARDDYELALARAASEQRVPTLAICRGTQVVNVALGGTLIQDLPSRYPDIVDHAPANRKAERVHDVSVDPSSRLANIVDASTIRINSSHHQAVDRLGDGLRVTARSCDNRPGDGIVEAIESSSPDWWLIGVQWHPEELTSTPEDWDRRLFAAFAAQAHAQVANRQRASSRT